MKTGSLERFPSEDTFLPKLFSLALEDVDECLSWEGRCINIDGKLLNHLHTTMIQELKDAPQGLQPPNEPSKNYKIMTLTI